MTRDNTPTERLIQLTAPARETPEERTANFSKMLRAFVFDNRDAEGGS